VNEVEFSDRLRAAGPPAEELSAETLEKLVTYWNLLARWNAVINLTALPLDPPSDAALQRLLIEPMEASRNFPKAAKMWFDLGSGGGSPAIPLKLLHPHVPLVLVEVRSRKAAFLREAVRTLLLSDVEVLSSPFEKVALERPGVADVITARAVKHDAAFAATVRALLGPMGCLLSFQTGSKPLEIQGLTNVASWEIAAAGPTLLATYVPRGTRNVDR